MEAVNSREIKIYDGQIEIHLSLKQWELLDRRDRDIARVISLIYTVLNKHLANRRCQIDVHRMISIQELLN